MANFPNLTINDTGNITLPVGTTSQRPGSASDGYTRFNSDDNILETRIPSAWQECRRELKEAGKFLYYPGRNKGIQQYNSSGGPYNFDTSYDFSFDAASIANAEDISISFSHDGNLFFVGSNDNYFVVSQCSTPFDISTASVINSNITIGTSSAGTGYGITFYNFGYFGWVSRGQGIGSGNIYDLYQFATPYDISSSSFVKSHSLSGVNGHSGTVSFNPDGTRAFIGERAGNSQHHQYNLATPFDLSTESSRQSTTVSENDAVAIQFTASGYHYYTGNHSPDGINRYTVDTPFDITSRISQQFLVDPGDQAGTRLAGNGICIAGAPWH